MSCGRAFGGAQNKRARDTAKKATAAAGKRGGGAASAAARDFVPAEVDSGWWFGEDVADKPGWIVDAPGTQHISFPVSASRGIVKLAYLRTDLATMGKAHVWVSAAPGGTLLGRPVIFNEHSRSIGQAGDIQFVNPNGYEAFRKQNGVSFADSIHLYFDYNIRAFRWVFRIGGQPVLSKPVTPANGNTTKSHFLALAERA